MKCRWALLLAGVVAMADAQTSNRFVGSSSADGAGDETPWRELQFEPPEFPKLDKLREFYVSAMATNKYFIDPATLTVGADGVVRYVLVVKTAGGATNVSYEGMLCKDRTWKLYATGHTGSGTWAKAPAASSVWRPIENIPVNRHHAALSHDLFCPLGNAIGSADEGRNALRLGKHPNAN